MADPKPRDPKLKRQVKTKGSKGKVGDGIPGPGRPKGSKNKITTDMRSASMRGIAAAGAKLKRLKRNAWLKSLDDVDAYIAYHSDKSGALGMMLVNKMNPAQVDLEVSMHMETLLATLTTRRDKLAARRAKMVDVTPKDIAAE